MAVRSGWISADLVRVFSGVDKEARLITTLAWGDQVDVIDEAKPARIRLRTLRADSNGVRLVDVEGVIKRAAKDVIAFEQETLGVLKLDFVDVQQGDAAIVETPEGQVILIDGGDNQMFARYLASRFQGTSPEAPQKVACVVITHGDADHFDGLTEIQKSESFSVKGNPAETARKRLFIAPERVYHNGLVKRPAKDANGKTRPDEALLGKTAKGADGALFITGLENDPRDAKKTERNKFFNNWCGALDAWEKRMGRKIDVRRLSRPLDVPADAGPADAFDFLAHEQIRVDLLGPLEEKVAGKPALRFLGNPSSKIARQPGESTTQFSGLSASHTINGHSMVLRLQYRNFSALFAGDLNEQSEEWLTREHDQGHVNLTSEVFKVPHHGSADFSVKFLKRVSPVVSVVSSGDENAQKEFIHPRATLMGALSKQGRASVEEPLVFVTELAAFFKVEGWTFNDSSKVTHKTQLCRQKKEFFSFTRAAFGIVKVRTDGNRMLIYTYSGKQDMKEAYAFKLIDKDHIEPDRVTSI
jgi:beta-lactamase superfamily II metal-dependent hydrolase